MMIWLATLVLVLVSWLLSALLPTPIVITDSQMGMILLGGAILAITPWATAMVGNGLQLLADKKTDSPPELPVIATELPELKNATDDLQECRCDLH